jgi:hypothetical protein
LNWIDSVIDFTMEKDSNNSENDGVSASTYSSFPPDMIIPRERARQNIAKQFNLWSSEPDEAFSRMVMIAQRVFRVMNIYIYIYIYILLL